MITRPAESEGKTPELTKGKHQSASDKDPSVESNETEPQISADPVDGPTTGTAAVVPSPKRKVLTFPKCPHRDKPVDFELGPEFIMEEELSTQNADVKESNVMTTKRNRRKPDEYMAVSASRKGNQLAASAVVLCACMHCLFIRSEGFALAMLALLADLIVLLKNYENAIAGPYAEQWKGACQKESGALKRVHVFDSKTPCPAFRKPIKSKWVWKCKPGPNGFIKTWKARLVILGCLQRQYLDYNSTFATTARSSTIRILLSVAGTYDLELRNYDIVSAFLGQAQGRHLSDAPGRGLRIPEGASG
jgi:hypothetical protein